PYIAITSDENEKNISLIIRDNGIGVKSYDLPFIFEKGFTGEIGEQRKNSTGMGLYLAEQVAKSLKIKLEVSEKYTEGFEISLIFPKIAY
ncbi:sensor histidine kinase, partial [Clostridium saudiense]|nr:sensor histidine kinase [Clostridium saudiense]